MIDLAYGVERLFLVVADEAASAACAAAAIEDAGGRVATTVRLADAAGQLNDQSRVDGIIVELAGCDADSITRSVPLIAHLAADRKTALCLSAMDEHVDALWAVLPDLSVPVLVDADVTDRVVALATLPRGGRLNDASRADDERRRLVNLEVSRFAETLMRLANDGPPDTAALRDVGGGYAAEATTPAPSEPIDAGAIRNLIRARRMRATHFAGDLFADPAWDMLLDLFAAEIEHSRVSVSSLCIAAAVPGTTALRWIGTMIDARLFERKADVHDRRRAYVALTDVARRGMYAYFDAVRRAGLSPA